MNPRHATQSTLIGYLTTATAAIEAVKADMQYQLTAPTAITSELDCTSDSHGCAGFNYTPTAMRDEIERLKNLCGWQGDELAAAQRQLRNTVTLLKFTEVSLKDAQAANIGGNMAMAKAMWAAEKSQHMEQLGAAQQEVRSVGAQRDKFCSELQKLRDSSARSIAGYVERARRLRAKIKLLKQNKDKQQIAKK
jgi:hypothetical protein